MKRHTFSINTTQTFCCPFLQFGFLLGAASIYPLIDLEIANIDYVSADDNLRWAMTPAPESGEVMARRAIKNKKTTK